MNKLVLVLDSLRYKTVVDSPTFDEIENVIKEHGGRKYTEARSPSIWSLPSHVSMFSGVSPYQHGVVSSSDSLSDESKTVFSSSSKKCGVFGSNPYLHEDKFGLKRHFDDVHTKDADFFSDNSIEHLFKVCKTRLKSGSVINDMKSYISNQNSEWSVFATLMDSHAPYIPGCSYYGDLRYLLNPRNVQYQDTFERTDDQYDIMEDLYKSCVDCVGKRVISLLRYLERAGELEQTHVIITSDHGEGFGEENITRESNAVFHYNSLNSELLHVPLYELVPSVNNLQQIDRLSALENLPTVLSNESETFVTDKLTSSVLFGGNVSIDDNLSGWGKVKFVQEDGQVTKYACDSQGAWSNKDLSEREIRNRVSKSFDDSPNNELVSKFDADDELKQRLKDLGYR